MQILVLAGGSPHAHDFGSIGDALVERITAAGHECALHRDPDAAAAALSQPQFDALIIDGLWWQMNGDAYDEWRDDHGYQTPAATRTAITNFVASGGGLVGLHTTPICFDDWPEWGDVVGGAWNWGKSSHPPYGPVRATVISDHDITEGLGASIELDDEVYGGLDVRAGVHVLATAKRHDGDDDQPVVWTHRYGDGRVVFNGFGHNAASIRHPQNGRIIDQSVAWVTST